jgi:tRNA(fMet)-specific endonuclease VapC
MSIFLLDTDVLSHYQRNHPQVVAAIESHATDQLCVSTVTLEEQIGGWSASARSAKTPLAEEHAAMLLAAIVVSWNRFAIARTHDRSGTDAVRSARQRKTECETQRFADCRDCSTAWSNGSHSQSP